jgi:DNA-binding response OmpR family regulator
LTRPIAPDVTPPQAPVDRAAVRIDPQMRSITLGAEPVELTKLEYDLMLFLAEHPRTVFTRLQLLTAVWGHLHAGVRTVDVHIRRPDVVRGHNSPEVVAPGTGRATGAVCRGSSVA